MSEPNYLLDDVVLELRETLRMPAHADEVISLRDERDRLRAELDAANVALENTVRLRDKYEAELDALRNAAPVPPAAVVVPDGYTPVKTDTLLWLLGEREDFECPRDQYFRGKPTPYFWRKRLRVAMLAATTEGRSNG